MTQVIEVGTSSAAGSAARPNGAGQFQHFCNSCNEGFATMELLKQHHFDDRHVYNVKRKLEGIEPISQ